MCRSVRQTPQARTRRSICPRAASGAGTSSRASGRRGPRRTIARMALACLFVKTLMSREEVARYADAVVKVGLALGRGDDLLVNCQPAHREFAVAVVEAGYRAGARNVDVDYVDPLIRAAYLRAAPDAAVGVVTRWRAARLRAMTKPETASLWIAGEGEPGALDAVPGARVAEDVKRSTDRLSDLRRESRLGKRRWSIAGWPTPAWAKKVYPRLNVDEAQRRLGRDLLDFCRVGPNDPPGITGLREHLRMLQQRARRLTRLNLSSLELRGRGT